MLSVLVVKELKAILLSPKFAATFAVASVLIVMSVFIGIQEYRNAVRSYEADLEMTDQNLHSQSSWMRISTEIYRRPDPMQIFVAGTVNDIGRKSPISQFENVKLKHSAYADDPIFAIFRSIDVGFIVTVVLSLFAVLFTYDSINGEREGGTLQLTLANPVSRGVYIFAKVIGSWIGLAVPLVLPVMLGLLLVLLFNIPLTADHWVRLGVLGVMSLLLFTFFVVFGVLISSLTKRSVVSFLVSLVVWVSLVLIVPRVAVMVAGKLVSVPTIAEIEGQRDAFAKDAREKQMQQMVSAWKARNEQMSGMSPTERDAYRKDHEGTWLAEDEKARSSIDKEIDSYYVRLSEDMRNKQSVQQQLATVLARLSPAATYQFTAMKIAGTDPELKARYEDAMRAFRTAFIAFAEKKQKESGDVGGFRITVDSERGVSFSAPREGASLDFSGMPSFVYQLPRLGGIAGGLLLDGGLLALATLLAFGWAFAAFLRFDVR